MKRTSYVLIAMLTLASVTPVWAQAPATAPATPVTPVKAPVVAPATAPVAPVAAVPAVTTTPPSTTTPPAVAAAPPAAVPPLPGSAPLNGKKGAPEDLRQAMQTSEFLKKLSFPLTEAQMVEFARASVKVAKINSKWDVQIAGAETDKMAIEYSNLAVEEIQHSLKSIPGLTLDQYNELTNMASSDKEFTSIYQAYKQLVMEGAFGEIPKGGALPARHDAVTEPSSSAVATFGTSSVPVMKNTAGANSSASGGTALPDAAKSGSTLPSTTAGSGIAPALPGSPTPPYSPPASH